VDRQESGKQREEVHFQCFEFDALRLPE
jgi:hypothetical protein